MDEHLCTDVNERDSKELLHGYHGVMCKGILKDVLKSILNV